jgi:hypothetical protein
LKIAAKVCVMPPPKARHVFEFGFPEVANRAGEHFARRLDSLKRIT